MSHRFWLAVGLVLSCSVAAARPIEVPTPIAAELPVELVLDQQEMAVEVPQTASAVGMQFGLIGAIIGSAVQNSQAKKAEARVIPLRDLLVRYRFNQQVEDALRAKLASDGLSPHPQLTVRQSAWDQAQANAHPASMQALVLAPRYAMSYDFQRLNVTLATSLVQRTPKSNGKYKTKVLFSRNYQFDFPLTAPAAQDEDVVQRWVALGGDGLARLLDEGIAQTTDMLAYDFSPTGRAEWTLTGKGEFAQAAGQRYPGHPVRQGEGWAWVRAGKGWMQALSGHQPLDAHALAAFATPVAPVATDAVAPVQATTVAPDAPADPPVATDADAGALSAAPVVPANGG
jgi:hypothetical protein